MTREEALIHIARLQDAEREFNEGVRRLHAAAEFYDRVQCDAGSMIRGTVKAMISNVRTEENISLGKLMTNIHRDCAREDK